MTVAAKSAARPALKGELAVCFVYLSPAATTREQLQLSQNSAHLTAPSETIGYNTKQKEGEKINATSSFSPMNQFGPWMYVCIIHVYVSPWFRRCDPPSVILG